MKQRISQADRERIFREMQAEHLREIGSAGGQAAASGMTDAERKERAAKAGKARWKGHAAKRKPKEPK